MVERKAIKAEARKELKILYWRNVLIGFLFTLSAIGALNEILIRLSGGQTTAFSIYNFLKNIIHYVTGKDFLAVTADSPSYQQVLYPILDIILAILVTFFLRNYTFPAYIAYTIVGHDFENISKGVFPTEVVFYILVAYFIYLLITFLLLKPLHVGAVRYFLSRAEGKTTNGREIFTSFNRYYNNIVFNEIWRSLLMTLWSLTVVGGIIKFVHYYYVDEILAENPTLKPQETLRLSRKIVRSHFWDIYLFELSFFGWKFLSLFTGTLLSFFFVAPYQYLSRDLLYVNLRQEAIAEDLSITRQLGYIDDESRLGFIARTGKLEDVDYSLSDYIFIFFTVAIGGWVWEVALHIIQTLQFTNRGSLWGPWLPIYGFGAVAALFLLRKKRKKYPWLVFLLSLLICSVIEYLTGWICDLSGRPLWNYYGMPLALPYHHNPAYICFYGSMAFGFGCTFAVYYAGPYFYSLYHNIPSKPKWIILSLLIAAMVADCCVTIFYKKNPGGVDESGLENVKETIRLIGGK